ncbi:unnamed protein product [Bursaphelenchus okinawaensis]|uniref:Uncharacterized protein n=1 Tax=Bursaphelenchus okinawaensis TaxID=465554 RepID=A0A811KNI7_9BILA|nr:unnamed protein product [Bursaphelenchus okinawaensis]CAG9107567.1 unnamed protein product [Bursaphelenchus okinawaensis]
MLVQCMLCAKQGTGSSSGYLYLRSTVSDRYKPNTIRGVSVCFSEKAVQDTCKRLNLDFIILAHQVMYNGYSFFAGVKMITVFSCPRCALDSKAAVMVITKKKEMGFAFLGPNKSDKLSTDKEFKEKFGYLDKLQQAEDIGGPPNPDRSEDTKGNDSNSASLNDSPKPKEVKKEVKPTKKAKHKSGKLGK